MLKNPSAESAGLSDVDNIQNFEICCPQSVEKTENKMANIYKKGYLFSIFV